MLKLIINADDFGLSKRVNDSILKSFETGILRSASLLANGKFFYDAVEIINANPELDVGVHLTLVGGSPILDAAKVSSIVNRDGNFYEHAFNFSVKYFANRVSLKEVKSELSAQIEKILDYGIKISHIDSHQHLHILPKIFDLTVKLADHYKIKFIRFPKERLCRYMLRDLRYFPRIIQMASLNFFCFIIKDRKFNKTNSFVGFFWGGKMNKKKLLTIINNLPEDGICELMCHPGFTEDSARFSARAYRRVEEMNALTDSEVVKLLNKRKIEITCFNALCQ